MKSAREENNKLSKEICEVRNQLCAKDNVIEDLRLQLNNLDQYGRGWMVFTKSCCYSGVFR